MDYVTVYQQNSTAETRRKGITGLVSLMPKVLYDFIVALIKLTDASTNSFNHLSGGPRHLFSSVYCGFLLRESTTSISTNFQRKSEAHLRMSVGDTVSDTIGSILRAFHGRLCFVGIDVELDKQE